MQLILEEEQAATTAEITGWITEASAWEDAARGIGGETELWMSQLWLGSWWEVYGASRAALRVAAVGWKGASLCPLRMERRGGVRRLAFLGSEHQRHAFADPGAAEEMAAWLGRRKDWDEIDLRGVPRAEAEAWMAGFRAANLRTSRSEPWRQRYVPLDRPWTEVEAEFRSGMRRNIDNRERALQRAAKLRFRLVQDAAEVAEVFDACVAMEASGWKGANGTALACDPKAQRFYRSVAFRAAERGQLCLALLFANETLAAFGLDVRSGRVQVGLKKGYLHAWRQYAPGLVLQRWMLREAHAAGMREVDLSGGDEPYKAELTPHTRELLDVRAYNRTALGGAARVRAGTRRGLTRVYHRARLSVRGEGNVSTGAMARDPLWARISRRLRSSAR